VTFSIGGVTFSIGGMAPAAVTFSIGGVVEPGANTLPRRWPAPP
jgi:hypothetical protein